MKYKATYTATLEGKTLDSWVEYINYPAQDRERVEEDGVIVSRTVESV